MRIWPLMTGGLSSGGLLLRSTHQEEEWPSYRNFDDHTPRTRMTFQHELWWPHIKDKDDLPTWTLMTTHPGQGWPSNLPTWTLMTTHPGQGWPSNLPTGTLMTTHQGQGWPSWRNFDDHTSRTMMTFLEELWWPHIKDKDDLPTGTLMNTFQAQGWPLWINCDDQNHTSSLDTHGIWALVVINMEFRYFSPWYHLPDFGHRLYNMNVDSGLSYTDYSLPGIIQIV